MINCLVAIEKNQGIGFNNSMPWPHLAGDMQWFKKMTQNQIVIMGSKTWKSLPFRPLPNRINVVLSRSENYCGVRLADHTFSDLQTAVAFCELEYKDKEIFIIGGSEIYKSALPIIENFYITEIEESYQCDKFFDFDYVKNNCTYKKNLLSYNTPVNYNINLYKK